MTTDTGLDLLYPAPHVAQVRLNRPGAHNAINSVMTAALAASVAQLEADPEVRVVLFSAAGERVFCAGADLREATSRGVDGLFTESGGFAGLARQPRRKPWIAVVEGDAIGGGFELVLACDLVVASRTARFSLPEAKIGVFAGGGGAVRLARRLPVNLAAELLLTGASLSAEKAYRHGLVNRLASPGMALEFALLLACQIADNAPLVVQGHLQVMRQSVALDEEALWALSQGEAERIGHSRDAREGPRAFFEKRPPQWQNC